MIDHNLTIQNNYFTTDMESISKLSEANKVTLEKPNPIDISSFQKAMSSDNTVDDAKAPASAEDAQQLGGQSSGDQMLKILTMLLELLMMITEAQKETEAGDDSVEGEQSTGSSPAKVENDKIVNANNIAAGDGEIPKPSEHLQNFSLGDKEIVIGGDGSASASEVQQTKETLSGLYDNSTSFKEMIDSSPNESFEVSVGRKDDNMSWGNADGRVFMNINNIEPDSSDSFQALTAHEFSHAGIDQQHGAEMKQFEQTVAAEA
jgi:hypothetical protein